MEQDLRFTRARRTNNQMVAIGSQFDRGPLFPRQLRIVK